MDHQNGSRTISSGRNLSNRKNALKTSIETSIWRPLQAESGSKSQKRWEKLAFKLKANDFAKV